MSKKIITVIGATGKQGGGVVEALLKDGSFAVRAVTRDPRNGKAKVLADKGVEVIAASLDDQESLIKAFTGAYGVFGVTDFWTAFQSETEQGKRLVDAAKATGIQHFVWSTLDGGHGITHFDTKAAVDTYLKENDVPHTLLKSSYFLDNIASYKLKRKAEGEGLVVDSVLATDGAFPAIFSRDIGKFALVAFKNPSKYIGGEIHAVMDVITLRQILRALEKVINAPVSVGSNGGISLTTFNTFRYINDGKFEELWLNMKFFYENSTCRGDPKDAEKLVVSEGLTLTNLEAFLKEQHAAGAFRV